MALISLGYGFLRVLPAVCNNHLATGMYLLGVKIALLAAEVNSYQLQSIHLSPMLLLQL